MPSRMHELSSAAIRYKTPADSNSMPKNLENWVDSFAASEGAKRLQVYCTTAGLIPLSSEWWHFNDPNAAKIAAKGVYSRETAVNTKGNCTFDRIDSVTPMTALTILIPWAVPLDGPTGGAGGLNPGSPGGSKPGSTNVSWATLSGRTFLRFTLIEFPKGVVTDLNTTDYGTWHVVGTPLNVMWGKDSGGTTYDGTYARSNITWYNSSAMRYNGMGTSAPSLMAGPSVAGGVYSFDATAGDNQRWVMTAEEFQEDTGISDTEKDRMFNLSSASWSSGWLNGDYTSMWGTDPQPVTPENLYTVYQPNKAFLYLLNRLSERGTANPGWSEEDAIKNWSSFVQDDSGNLRTRYRIIVETGAVITDPDGYRRAMTLRDVMAYTLYNDEPNTRYHLIYDQTPTEKNMAQWMRQAITQFVEYPLGSDGMPTGEELFSTNGFTEADSFVDSISSVRDIRDKIFSERRSFGLHIFSPFNFVMPTAATTLEVTKKTGPGITDGGTWGFTVKYTEGTPTSFTATKGGTDCTGEVSDTGSGLHFSLAKDETIHIEFTVDGAFSYEVSEDDPTDLTDITGTGGTAGKANNKFTSDSSNAATAAHEQPILIHPQLAGTLCASGAGLSRPAGMGSELDFCITSAGFRYRAGSVSDIGYKDETAPTLMAEQEAGVFVSAVDCRNLRETAEISGTLQAKTKSGGYSLNYQNPVRVGFCVRRLLPVEAERLMGFPDFWTEYGHDGKPISDTKRYSMLGNSIAVPCGAYIIQGIRDALLREGR